jgi:hypothetical protein
MDVTLPFSSGEESDSDDEPLCLGMVSSQKPPPSRPPARVELDKLLSTSKGGCPSKNNSVLWTWTTGLHCAPKPSGREQEQEQEQEEEGDESGEKDESNMLQNGEEGWEVFKVRDHRLRKGKRNRGIKEDVVKYLVEWKDPSIGSPYPDSWEPVEGLQCVFLIDEYWGRLQAGQVKARADTQLAVVHADSKGGGEITQQSIYDKYMESGEKANFSVLWEWAMAEFNETLPKRRKRL